MASQHLPPPEPLSGSHRSKYSRASPVSKPSRTSTGSKHSRHSTGSKNSQLSIHRGLPETTAVPSLRGLMETSAASQVSQVSLQRGVTTGGRMPEASSQHGQQPEGGGPASLHGRSRPGTSPSGGVEGSARTGSSSLAAAPEGPLAMAPGSVVGSLISSWVMHR